MRVSLWICLWIACGAETPSVPTLELGLGAASTFVSVPDGATAALHPGAQGGFHIFLQVRTRGLADGRLNIKRTGRRVRDGMLVTRAMDTKMLLGKPDQEGWYTLEESMLTFLCPTPIGISVAQESIRFEVEATDALMRTVSDTLVLVPLCGEESAAFCAKICYG